MTEFQPHLSIDFSPSEAEAVVLVLHGGRVSSTAAVQARQLAVLRMVPFAHRIGRLGGRRVAVARLLNATRGWNAGSGAPAPVRDAEWALRQLTERFGELPIGLVGHSMGGRTALRVAGQPLVRAVVGLASWLPPGEPVEQLRERRVLLMHGTADRTTDPAGTAAFAGRLEAAGVPVSVVDIKGDGHPMLRRRRLWHELSAQFVLSAVLPGYQPSDSMVAPNPLRQVIEGPARITY